MSSASSPTLVYSSPLTISRQWNPRQVLDLAGDGCCVGWALTKEQKCCNRILRETVRVFDDILIDLSSQPLDAALLEPTLKNLAQNGLCKRYHRRTQVEYMVREWSDKINGAAQSAELAAAAQASRSNTRITTTSFASPQPSPTTVTHGLRRPTSVTISTTLSVSADCEPQSIQGGTEAVYEQTRAVERSSAQLLTSDMPHINSDSSVTRFSTTDSSRHRLSQTLSTTSSAESPQTTRNSSSTTSSRSTSPARSTPSRPSYFTSSSSYSSSPPSSPPVLSMRRTQHVSGTSATTSGNPATITPLSQNPTVSSCTKPHVRRLSFSGECPICSSDEPLSSHPACELVWCTSSCGNTLHKSCFDEWAAQCQKRNLNLSCPFCRADWTGGCGCGGLSRCDTVHVTKRSTDELCSVCREDMRNDKDEELEWCKDGCGKSVHKSCANTWVAHCIEEGKKPTCTSCRAEWRLECNC